MEEILEIEPKQIKFDLQHLENKISIQNLTLHFIQVKVLSPNPTLFTIIPQLFSIEPCTTSEVIVKMNLDFRMNLNALLMNRKLVIFFYDVDEVEELGKNDIDWTRLPINYLGRQEIDIHYETGITKVCKLQNNFLDNVQIFQALFIKQKNIHLNDEHKKTLINKYLELHNKYQTYKIMEDSILFIANGLDLENEIYCIESNNQIYFISSFKPTYLFHTQPKHPIEPPSPQRKKQIQAPIVQIINTDIEQPQQKVEFSPVKQFLQVFTNIKKKSEDIDEIINVKQVEQTQNTQSNQNFESKQEQQEQKQIQTEVIQQEKQQKVKLIKDMEASVPERINRRLMINEQSSLTNDIKTAQRQAQRSLSIDERRSLQIVDQKNLQQQSNIAEMTWDKKAKFQQKQMIAPPVVFTGKDNIQAQQASYKVNELGKLKTYQNIVQVLIFRDGKYLITIGDKNDIKVWQLSIRGLVGTIKDLENKKDKKILIINEWRYVDPAADENYEFELKDPKNETKIQELYTPYETAYRFVIGCEDQIFRIYNLTTMTLEQQFSSRLQIPTSIIFMPDRGLFCIGGQPNKTIFGQMRKYRSIRFFCMKNLQEKPKYKIFCKSEDEYLNKIIYSENPNEQKEHYHARINNILVIHMIRRNNQQKQIAFGDRVLFVFMDRMNQCTVLMTLECEPLNIRGIHDLKYLYKEGVFALIEAHNVVNVKNSKIEQNTQKVVLVNLKQLQTSQGKESGIECNLIQEQRSKLSLQILVNPMLLVIPQQKQIVFQNFKGEDQIVHLTGDINYLSVTNNYITSIVDDSVEVISII